MKKIALIGSLILVAVAAIALVMAVNYGEKSPAYAAGTVTLAPQLEEKAEYAQTLFIVVFQQGVPMPYGAMKIRLDQPLDSRTPFAFRITKERLNLMNENRPLPTQLRLKFRLDLDGVAGPDQPGDLVGEAHNVALGTTNLKIEIDKYTEQR